MAKKSKTDPTMMPKPMKPMPKKPMHYGQKISGR